MQYQDPAEAGWNIKNKDRRTALVFLSFLYHYKIFRIVSAERAYSSASYSMEAPFLCYSRISSLRCR